MLNAEKISYYILSLSKSSAEASTDVFRPRVNRFCMVLCDAHRSQKPAILLTFGKAFEKQTVLFNQTNDDYYHVV